MFRNLPLCESKALPDQRFNNLILVGRNQRPKRRHVTGISAAVNHAMAVGAQQGKVGRHIITDWHTPTFSEAIMRSARAMACKGRPAPSGKLVVERHQHSELR